MDSRQTPAVSATLKKFRVIEARWLETPTETRLKLCLRTAELRSTDPTKKVEENLSSLTDTEIANKILSLMFNSYDQFGDTDIIITLPVLLDRKQSKEWFKFIHLGNPYIIKENGERHVFIPIPEKDAASAKALCSPELALFSGSSSSSSTSSSPSLSSTSSSTSSHPLPAYKNVR